MWISTLHLEPKRVLLTKILGLFYPNVYYSPISPLQVHNLPRQPLPSPNWVRVRNRLAGICGSDLHLIFADADPRIASAALPGHPQLYPGHEVVGEVIEIGNDVQHLQVGDRVVLQNAPNCLSTGIYSPCRSCAAGNYNLCEQGVLPGPQPIGGGWSEEMLLHEQQLFRLPDQLSDEQGVLLEPTAVALHAVLRHLPQPSDRVLIIGAGTIGLLTLQIIRALVPEVKVSVLARHASQREQAKCMGATYLIHPTDSYGEMQQVTEAQLYRGVFGNRTLLGGYDVVFDTVGQRNTLYHALRWARAQATIVLIGVSLHMMRIDLTPIWHQQISLLGTTSHGMETWPPQTQQRSSTFSIAAELIAQDLIHPEELITHRFALKNYKDALVTTTRKAHSHAIKVIFDYSLQPASAVPDPKAILRTPLPLSTNTGAFKATPVSTSTAVKARQKPVDAIPHDHAKDDLRQLRRSLGLSPTSSKLQTPSSGESQPKIKAAQRPPESDISEPHPSSETKTVMAPTDQDQASLTAAETLPESSDSHQPTPDSTKVQEPVAQDKLDLVAQPANVSVENEQSQELIDHEKPDLVAQPANASVENEQDAPTVETPTLTISDQNLAAKSEIAQPPANLTPEKSLTIIEEDRQLTTEEKDQLTLPEDSQSTGNESASPVQVKKKNGATSGNDVFSFPEVEKTPTVRVRPKRGVRKRKTKPFV